MKNSIMNPLKITHMNVLEAALKGAKKYPIFNNTCNI